MARTRKRRPSPLGARVLSILESRGLTCYRLAAETGFTRTTISNLVYGADPKLSSLEKIASALGVRLRDLVDPD